MKCGRELSIVQSIISSLTSHYYKNDIIHRLPTTKKKNQRRCSRQSWLFCTLAAVAELYRNSRKFRYLCVPYQNYKPLVVDGVQDKMRREKALAAAAAAEEWYSKSENNGS